MPLLSPVAFVAGGLSWSLAEYGIHRFVGHGPRRRKNETLRDMLTPIGLASEFHREHTAHHMDPTYFAPARRKLLAATAAGVVVGAAASAVLGPRRGISFTLGLLGTYAGYEVIHRRIHTHAPRNRFARWARKNHLLHHRAPKSNHGVTSPAWDLAFRTHVPLGRVRLGRTVAPAWLLDDDGNVRPEHASDYEVPPVAAPAVALVEVVE